MGVIALAILGPWIFQRKFASNPILNKVPYISAATLFPAFYYSSELPLGMVIFGAAAIGFVSWRILHRGTKNG